MNVKCVIEQSMGKLNGRHTFHLKITEEIKEFKTKIKSNNNFELK